MKTIRFEITYIKNPQIHQKGFVEVPDDIKEIGEFYYYDQYGFAIPREFTHHDGIGLTQIGATDEQLAELDKFLYQVHIECVDWVAEIICFEEDENRTFRKGDLVFQINDGEISTSEICKEWEKLHRD